MPASDTTLCLDTELTREKAIALKDVIDLRRAHLRDVETGGNHASDSPVNTLDEVSKLLADKLDSNVNGVPIVYICEDEECLTLKQELDAIARSIAGRRPQYNDRMLETVAELAAALRSPVWDPDAFSEPVVAPDKIETTLE